eukprot:448063_1
MSFNDKNKNGSKRRSSRLAQSQYKMPSCIKQRSISLPATSTQRNTTKKRKPPNEKKVNRQERFGRARRTKSVGQGKKMKMTKPYLNVLDMVQKGKMNTTQQQINIAWKKVHSVTNSADDYNKETRKYKLHLIENIRLTLLNELYPLPNFGKKIAWFLLIIWSMFCVFLAIYYGIQFDLLYEERAEFLGKCWSNDKIKSISYDLSIENIKELQNSLNPNHSSNFPGDITNSITWLLSIFESVLLSIFLWQPLTIYFITFIKVWMLTWNVRMGVGPGKIKALCKNACCMCRKSKTIQDIILSTSQSEINPDLNVLADESRPLDLIGFLSNEKLFLSKPNQMDSPSSITTSNDHQQIELQTINKHSSESQSDSEIP